jgi:hypothetical protein
LQPVCVSGLQPETAKAKTLGVGLDEDSKAMDAMTTDCKSVLPTGCKPVLPEPGEEKRNTD